MASRNVNKIKPWMLAKNTNEIVSNYVQNIYKQMPMSFNKGLKSPKVATNRPENRGPLSTWKNEQKQLPSNSITPRMTLTKKSSSSCKMKQQTNNILNYLKMNKSNQPFNTNNLMSNKRLLKTPNYKIYKTLRYGSSCSSSRSTIFKRHDERKRQRQNNVAQINYLIRSFHTSKFEPTYARFLMPARNQQLETNLGSIPAAIKFSNNMLKDLMTVNKSTKNKITKQQEKNIVNMQPAKRYNLDKWHHPPSLSKYKIKTPKEESIKNAKSITTLRTKSIATLTHENRNYARLNVDRISPLRCAKPAHELFTPQHDRHKTELHEKHRRNRMKKLGLIHSNTASERSTVQRVKSLKASKSTTVKSNEQPKSPKFQINKKVPRLGNQMENRILPPLLIKSNKVLDENNSSRIKEETFPATVSSRKITSPMASRSNTSTSSKYSTSLSYSTISPLVALRAQMPNKTDLGSYRYNRYDVFTTKKF